MRIVVVLTEGRRDVYDAGARIERHEVLDDDAPPERVVTAGFERDARIGERLRVIVEGRTVPLAGQVTGRHRAHYGQLVTEFFGQRGPQIARDDQLRDAKLERAGGLLAFALERRADLHHVIARVRAERGVAIGRQSPRRRGPDDERRIRLVEQRKSDVHAGIVDRFVAGTDLRRR